jgi:hypothetical protein
MSYPSNLYVYGYLRVGYRSGGSRMGKVVSIILKLEIPDRGPDRNILFYFQIFMTSKYFTLFGSN